jgi:hypothetical protein
MFPRGDIGLDMTITMYIYICIYNRVPVIGATGLSLGFEPQGSSNPQPLSTGGQNQILMVKFRNLGVQIFLDQILSTSMSLMRKVSIDVYAVT